MKEIVLYLSIKNNYNWEKINNDLQNLNFDIDWNKLNYLKEQYRNEYITFLDSNYPISFKKSKKAPFIFFYYGNINLLNNEKIWLKGEFKRLESILNIRQISKNSEIYTKKTFVLDKNTEIYDQLFFNENINKIIIWEENQNINFSNIDNNTLIISLKPIDLTNDFEINETNFLKSQISDKLLFINTQYSSDDLKSIINSIKNRTLTCALKIEDKFYKNNLLIKNGAIEIKNIKNI